MRRRDTGLMTRPREPRSGTDASPPAQHNRESRVAAGVVETAGLNRRRVSVEAGSRRGPEASVRDLVMDRLMASARDGGELVHEALLWRGFLVTRGDGSSHLAPGFHRSDLEVLSRILVAEPHAQGPRLRAPAGNGQRCAEQIMSIPEHRHGWIALRVHRSWARYRAMRWGHRVSVGPERSVHGGLDIGVALLVKALPLARVMTVSSCDGHGRGDGPAYLMFASCWDAAWFRAVFDAIGGDFEHCQWRSDRERLEIRPAEHRGTAEMLDGIHSFALRLLDRDLVDRIGAARARLLRALGYEPPTDFDGPRPWSIDPSELFPASRITTHLPPDPASPRLYPAKPSTCLPAPEDS